jgi:cysteine desulfurase
MTELPVDTIYLDHNSTTPMLPEVARALADSHLAGYANPASPHRPGRVARRALESACDQMARLLGADPRHDLVILTSGGTESNNLAVRGLEPGRAGRVIVSAIEHPSVLATAESLQRQGCDIRYLPVRADGVVDLEELPKLLDAEVRLVSVMFGNNETGVLQPIAELAELCQRAEVPLHTDAVQAVGKVPVDFRSLGVAAMTVSAHKFHGPLGIGALVVRRGVHVEPILHGGHQQWSLRPGTQSVPLAIGMLRALQLWHEESGQRQQRLRRLRDRLETRLRHEIPDLVINGGNAPRLPHTTNISFPGLNRQALLMALDQVGIACSTGSACASGSTEPSPVLLAMGAARDIVRGSLRISLGATTSAADVDRAACRILQVVKDLRNKKSARNRAIAPRDNGA